MYRFRQRLTSVLAAVALFALSGTASAQTDQDDEEEEVFVIEPDVKEGALVVEPEDDSETDAKDVDGDDPIDIPTVEVSSDRLVTVGGAAHRMDEDELHSQESDDPHEILLQVPGIYFRAEDGFGLRPNIGMRGANSERSKKVTLMEDGVLLGPAPYSAPAAYYFPIVSRMVGLEVFKGPGAVRYGPQTIGGAIDWKTREVPGETSAGVDINAGSYATGRAHGYVGVGTDWGGLIFEGVHWQSGGFKELDGGGDTGFNRQEFMLKGRLNTDAEADIFHSVTAKLGYSRELSDETYLGLTDDDFRDNPLRRYRASQLGQMDWDRTQAELRHQLGVGKNFSVETTAYRHDFQRSWRKLNGFSDGPSLAEILASPDTGSRAVLYDVLTGAQDSTVDSETLIVGTNTREYVSQGVQTVAQHRVLGDGWFNRVEAGVRLHNDRIERDHTADSYLMQGGTLESDGDPTETTTQNVGSTVALAGHLIDEFFIAELTLTPGVRVEHIMTEFEDLQVDETSSRSQTVFIPGVGVHYGFTPEFGVLAGVHRGFSPVSPGQPDQVDPETSVNYEAGLRYSDEQTRTLVEAIGFFNDYDNLIGECSFSAGCGEELLDRQFNAGQVFIYGAELTAAHSFLLGGDWYLPARLAYTLTDSQFQTSFTSGNPQFGEVEAGDKLPYVPLHQGSLQLGVTNQTLTFNGRLTYVGTMGEVAGVPGEVPETDAHFVLGALASYGVLEDLEVYGKVDNALDAQPIASRRPYGARPISPLTARLGVRWEY
jgi:Fe(3+) dicitrate transport protein